MQAQGPRASQPSPRRSIRMNHTFAESCRQGESLFRSLARSLGPAMYYCRSASVPAAADAERPSWARAGENKTSALAVETTLQITAACISAAGGRRRSRLARAIAGPAIWRPPLRARARSSAFTGPGWPSADDGRRQAARGSCPRLAPRAARVVTVFPRPHTAPGSPAAGLSLRFCRFWTVTMGDVIISTRTESRG